MRPLIVLSALAALILSAPIAPSLAETALPDETETIAVPPPRPTAAVGVIRRAGGSGGCSATLIGESLVLTAAHCVLGRTGRADPEKLTFRTGAYPGVLPLEIAAADIVVHPLYESKNDDISRRTGFDLALIRLSGPVPETVAVPLPVSTAPVTEDRLLLASWRGAVGARARERSCPLVTASSLVIVMGCDVRGGESGSPVLRRSGDGVEIVGVLSARAEDGQQKLAIAAGASRIGQVIAVAGPQPTAP